MLSSILMIVNDTERWLGRILRPIGGLTYGLGPDDRLSERPRYRFEMPPHHFGPAMPTQVTAALLILVSVLEFAGLARPAAAQTCGEDTFVRELTYRGRTGPWVPEREFNARAFPPPTRGSADPTTLVEVSSFHPDCPATAEQEHQARAFVERAFRVARERGWMDFEQAQRDGFEPYKHHEANETHFVNLEYSLDERVLDPEYPEYLMYYDGPDGEKRLVGMMFFVPEPEARGPQFGGPLTVWHYHYYEEPVCLHQMRVSSATESADGIHCEEGEPGGYRSPEMLHVWFVDHPEGPFATSMILRPEIVRQGIRPDLLALPR